MPSKVSRGVKRPWNRVSSMSPGETQLTRMPWEASSLAMALVGGKEDARQVEVDHLAPARLGHLEQRPALDEVSGVVDQDVDAAEALLHVGHEAPHLLEPGDVGAEDRGRSPAGGDGPGRLFRALPPAEVVTVRRNLGAA